MIFCDGFLGEENLFLSLSRSENYFHYAINYICFILSICARQICLVHTEPLIRCIILNTLLFSTVFHCAAIYLLRDSSFVTDC
jgi:hypothetical protein